MYGKDLNNEQLYRDILVAPDKSVMLLFISESMRKFVAANSAEKWELHMDGTFKILPCIGAKQLFVVHINYQKTVSVHKNIYFALFVLY